jgi:hypothetical protein
MTWDDAHSLDRLRQNLADIQGRIAAAAARAGRSDLPRLVAVTKYAPPEAARALIACGVRELGESRPQELWRKAEALAGLSVDWHLVGHLQRNKVRRTLPLVQLLHSADSLPLLEEIDREAARLGRPARVLLEVNISGDAAKHGFAPTAVAPLLPQLARLPSVRVEGLMTMAALARGVPRARRDFAALRTLRDQLAAECPPEVRLQELSMGMSDDFEAAIEEGATIVRVGSALFEGLAPATR